jgi:hypothetical protein
LTAGKKLVENFKGLRDNDLVTVVILSICYRTLKRRWTWLKNLLQTIKYIVDLELVQELATTRNHSTSTKMGFKLILTTDHGTINVKNPSKVVGDKNTSLNLRYKTGRSLTYEYKDVYAVKEPKK